MEHKEPREKEGEREGKYRRKQRLRQWHETPATQDMPAKTESERQRKTKDVEEGERERHA